MYRTIRGGMTISGGGPAKRTAVCWFSGKLLRAGSVRVLAHVVKPNKADEYKRTGEVISVSANPGLCALLIGSAMFEGPDHRLYETEVTA